MTYEDLERIKDPWERAAAIRGFLDRANAAVAQGKVLRDETILELLQSHTRPVVARHTGMSLSHIRLLQMVTGNR